MRQDSSLSLILVFLVFLESSNDAAYVYFFHSLETHQVFSSFSPLALVRFQGCSLLLPLCNLNLLVDLCDVGQRFNLNFLKIPTQGVPMRTRSEEILTFDKKVDDLYVSSIPGILSNPLSKVIQSSLVRHICANVKLTYKCLLNNLSASSMAKGTKVAFSPFFPENGSKNGRL